MKFKVNVEVNEDGSATIVSWRYPEGTLRQEMMDCREIQLAKKDFRGPYPMAHTKIPLQAHIALQKAMEEDREPLEVIDYADGGE